MQKERRAHDTAVAIGNDVPFGQVVPEAPDKVWHVDLDSENGLSRVVIQLWVVKGSVDITCFLECMRTSSVVCGLVKVFEDRAFDSDLVPRDIVVAVCGAALFQATRPVAAQTIVGVGVGTAGTAWRVEYAGTEKAEREDRASNEE